MFAFARSGAQQAARSSPKRKLHETDSLPTSQGQETKRLRSSARLSKATAEEAISVAMREEADVVEIMDHEDYMEPENGKFFSDCCLMSRL
jgi:hypothetical protein